MSSFLLTNTKIDNIDYVNNELKNYGKDLSEFKNIENVSLIYNHLFTDDYDNKYVYDDVNKIICVFDGFLIKNNILELYKKHGHNFYKFLDGEYAIAILDLKNKLLIACSDPFGCRHLSIGLDSDKIGVSTFKISLEKLKFKNILNVHGNTVFLYDLSNKKLDIRLNVEYDMVNPYKDSLDDWIKAFENSIIKKNQKLNNVSLSLSDGYDSGLIHCALMNLNIKTDIYSFVEPAKVESIKVLFERHKLHKNKFNDCLSKIIFPSKEIENEDRYKIHFENCVRFDEYTEQFYNPYFNNKDEDSYGINGILQLANFSKNRNNILLSGTDGDFHYFPFIKKNYCLNISVDEGARAARLVSGCFGLDARFVFFDKFLYQESYWLNHKVLNEYKAMHKYYFRHYNYPFFDTINNNLVPLKNDMIDRKIKNILKVKLSSI